MANCYGEFLKLRDLNLRSGLSCFFIDREIAVIAQMRQGLDRD